MTDQAPFSPDWVSPPGDTILDLIEEREWTQAELARRLDLTPKHINRLCNGTAPITADVATDLSTVLGSTPSFWLSREARYRSALIHQEQLEALKAHSEWAKQFPVPWMARQGWIPSTRHVGEKVKNVLEFFRVSSPSSWSDTYGQPLAAFRSSTVHEKKLGAVAAWMRQAEREASQIDCAPYDKQRFHEELPRIRALSRQSNPQVFLPALRQMCAESGVALVLLPAPPGCPIHGCTKWLSPHKALLGLTLRYKSDDQLWFSFFHEACHILKHRKKQAFIEGLDGLDNALEAEADRFATRMLIPPSHNTRLRALRSKSQVAAFAHELGIAPGVVVGRLQHEGLIQRNHMNGLKTRYEWAE